MAVNHKVLPDRNLNYLAFLLKAIKGFLRNANFYTNSNLDGRKGEFLSYILN